MDDLISRLGVAAWLDNMGYPNLAEAVMDKNRFPNERLNGKEQAMTELINKQKVLDLVRDICIDIMDECESYIDVIDGETDIVYKNLKEVNAILKCNKRIRNGIRQLPPESLENSEQLEWIPCGERLPNKDGYYLVCVDWPRDNVDVLRWADGWNCFRDFDGNVSRKSELGCDIVIAWMPLPKPWGRSRR